MLVRSSSGLWDQGAVLSLSGTDEVGAAGRG